MADSYVVRLDPPPVLLVRAAEQRGELTRRMEAARQTWDGTVVVWVAESAQSCAGCGVPIALGDEVTSAFGPFPAHLACSTCLRCGEWLVALGGSESAEAWGHFSLGAGRRCCGSDCLTRIKDGEDPDGEGHGTFIDRTGDGDDQ